MKKSNEVSYRFDWKSIYLVPLMALVISTVSLIMLIEFNENPDVEKTVRIDNSDKNISNIIAYNVNQ